MELVEVTVQAPLGWAPSRRFMLFHIAHVSNFRLCKMAPSSCFWSKLLSLL
jgi:hypothetical protein